MTKSEIIKYSLEEDLENGDVTTDPIFTDQETVAKLICKESGVIAGVAVFEEVINQVDDAITITWQVCDGELIEDQQLLATISGKTKSILHAERVALNLMQRMSGVATLTRAYVQQIASPSCQIYDTRKTTPMLRPFEKEAVLLGGGCNHRYNLGDQVLIKDNHIAAAGSITNAVSLTKQANPDLQIEVECETKDQVLECLATDSVDIIMLDNMDNKLMRECVQLIAGKAIVEASGNMSLERIAEVSKTGVDRISSGSLTHSYTSLDISLKIGV
ncbi:carboxylating nicotinate-nucleotide diphosphorylase [Mollicutes bacterium LVI A0039]|nr:carboxylating nicotinate-nucleotide diphosphorylase [Mollicutes bacterium LVI A0039]